MRSRVFSAVNAVESIIKHAGPKETENIIYKSSLVNKTSDSPWANQIERSTLFAAPTKIKAIKEEEVIVQFEEVDETGSSEIIFKGIADGIAYISIKKEIDGQWHEHGFPTRVGEKIGDKKIVGGQILDFRTNYVLQDIVYNAQRPVTLNKQIVNLNEAGEFVGTGIVPGETYMKSTSKIKLINANGNINELWLNEYEKMFIVEDEKSYEQVEDIARPAVSKEEVSTKGFTKQQQKVLNKAKKPFEKNIETLRSILEEAESGY